MAAPNAYRPSNGATLTIDAGIWSATGRPTVQVNVVIDARLLMSAVYDAARSTNNSVIYGLGSPRAKVTLTP